MSDEITVGGTAQSGYRALSPDGGSGAPTSFWGAIWDAALARKGILSQRLSKSMLDQLAQDQSAAAEADTQIDTLLQNARDKAPTDTDRRQLDVLASRQNMLRKLFGHQDPKVRAYAEAQMLDLNNQVGAYYEDLESRDERLEDYQTQQQASLRDKMRGEYRADIGKAQDSIDREQSDYDAVMGSLKDLGANSQVTQSLFQKYVNASAAGVDGLTIPGISGKPPSRDYTYDEIVKGAAAKLSAVKRSYQQRAEALIGQAQRDGFVLNNDDGTLQLNDLNVVRPQGGSRPAQPEDVAATDTENTLLEQARSGKGVGRVLNALPVLPKAADEMAGAMGFETTADRLRSAEQQIAEQRRRRALRRGVIRRPTN